MKNKTLVILGIIAWILSVMASAEDVSGNYTAPIILIAISAAVMLIFVITATIRLWKTQRITAILFLASSLVSFVYISAPTKIINFILLIWVISLLWVMAKHDRVTKNIKKEFGLTEEEILLLGEKWRNLSSNEKIQEISDIQKKQEKGFKEATGVNARDIIPEIGKEISWKDIINHSFQILDFDRNGTIINNKKQVKSRSLLQPYGYLLARSPILNNHIKLPIIHRDDFLLVDSVFDDPKLARFIEDEELLVTYAPKHVRSKGLSASPLHVLHYVIVPSGTLDTYYSVNNDIHMVKPEPQKLFGPFIYNNEIKVQIKLELEND